MRKKLFSLLLLVGVFLLGGFAWISFESSTQTMAFSGTVQTLVIDAGHGGEDGGAVSITGVSESQINLSIACKLEDILALYGVAPQMLRREDISLHNDSASTLREKKSSDLRNRVKAIEAVQAPILISIHQNSYPEQRYHGAQVFYAPTAYSKELAEHMQATLNQRLDPSNTRGCKQIPDSVYLMNHISCPAVLVECGFLTNPTEEALLRQEDYQRKIAACLTGALLTAPAPTNEFQEPSI